MQSLVQKCASRERQYKPDRLEYLDQLVIEFQTSKSKGNCTRAFRSLILFCKVVVVNSEAFLKP